MKKLLFLMLLCAVGAAAQPIVNIPDVNFKNKLLNHTPVIDINGDGEIQLSEAQATTVLYVENANIASLEGIQSFINLRELRATNNQISSVDLSQCLSLEKFYLDMNNILALDFSNHLLLKEISAIDNPMTSFNVTGAAALEAINIYDCPVRDLKLIDLPNLNFFRSSNLSGSLTVAGCSALQMVNTSGNLLTELTELNISDCALMNYVDISHHNTPVVNISRCPDIEKLFLRSMHLTGIDLSGFPKLKEVDFEFNDLTTIDFSNNPMLDEMRVSNNPLTSINMKNGSDESVIGFDASNMEFICADETQLGNPSLVGVWNPTVGYIPVSSYCSFTPGGNYNTVTGKAIFDQDNNGCDANDATYEYVKIKLNDGTTQASTFTNASGDYRFYTSTGNYTLTPEFENPAYFTATPSSATVNFPENDNLVTTQDFCFTANGVHPDLEIVIVPLGPARPGFNTSYQIVYKNKGNQTLSGNVNFHFDDALLDFMAASIVPDAQTTGLLLFNYSNLRPFESRFVNISLKVNAPTEIPPVNIDDLLNFYATINPLAADEMPEDNVSTFVQTVTGSFDPNDKQCIEGETVSEDHIGKYLHYIINFENTGTHVAENVVVKDTINTAQFDIDSLQILNASPGLKIKVTGNVVEFIFEGIHLPIGGHGNVLFKIKTKDNLPIRTEVSNVANIYFDYNIPIITNHATTRFSSLGAKSFTTDDSVSVYPNPSTDIVNIRAMHDIKSVSLYDLQGRLLDVKYASSKQVQLNLAQKRTGIYLVQVVTDKGSKAEKLIKK